jgi:hypothetical protein
VGAGGEVRESERVEEDPSELDCKFPIGMHTEKNTHNHCRPLGPEKINGALFKTYAYSRRKKSWAYPEVEWALESEITRKDRIMSIVRAALVQDFPAVFDRRPLLTRLSVASVRGSRSTVRLRQMTVTRGCLPCSISPSKAGVLF